jgi:hypothetical protein
MNANKQNTTNQYLRDQRQGNNMLLVLSVFTALAIAASFAAAHIPH